MAIKRKTITQTELLYLSLSLMILTITWISFNIYHIWATTTITDDLQIQIQPISPTFDTETLTSLQSRKKVTPQFVSINLPVASVSAPVNTPAPTLTPPLQDTSAPLLQSLSQPTANTSSNAGVPVNASLGVQGQ